MLCEPGSVWKVFQLSGSVWKVFQLVRANFEQFGAGPVSWGGLTTPRRSDVVQAV
jgi:hypothetical protein